MHDLAPLVQFKKREKDPWRSVTFSKACNFTKSETLPCETVKTLSRFLNCTNRTKSRNASHIYLFMCVKIRTYLQYIVYFIVQYIVQYI